MANQLEKFTLNFAQLSWLLRELLTKAKSWAWGPPKSKACDLIKKLSKSTTLALYDPAALTKISADASTYGLGAMLLQQANGPPVL